MIEPADLFKWPLAGGREGGCLHFREAFRLRCALGGFAAPGLFGRARIMSERSPSSRLSTQVATSGAPSIWKNLFSSSAL